jgi:hypothetical protein
MGMMSIITAKKKKKTKNELIAFCEGTHKQTNPTDGSQGPAEQMLRQRRRRSTCLGSTWGQLGGGCWGCRTDYREK